EEDATELLRRAEHELLARELVRPRLELLDALGETGRDLAHPVRVDADAGGLHLGENMDERHLDVAVERLGATLADALEQRLPQAPRDRRMADEPRPLLLRVRLGLRLDRVLRLEVVEEVLAPR